MLQELVAKSAPCNRHVQEIRFLIDFPKYSDYPEKRGSNIYRVIPRSTSHHVNRTKKKKAGKKWMLLADYVTSVQVPNKILCNINIHVRIFY